MRLLLALGFLATTLAWAAGCTSDEPAESFDGLEVSAPTRGRACPAAAPIRCAYDVGERLPLHVSGVVLGRGDHYGGASCGVGGEGIEDVAFRWTAPAAGKYQITTKGSTYDTLISVRSGSCAGREMACSDDAEEAGDGTSSVTIELAACRTITIVVDGKREPVADLELAIFGSENACNDGTDDDGDGATDCDDPDCFGRICPGEDHWPPAQAAGEWDVIELVNAERARGATCADQTFPPAPPLEADRFLRDAARWHSQDMLDNGYFDHESQDGRTPPDRASAAGFRGAGPIGENILSGSTDAEEAVAGWMASEGHCKNIMNADYRVTGVGYALSRSGSRWTQMFGGSH